MFQLSEVSSEENVTAAPTFKFYKAGQYIDSLQGAEPDLKMVEILIQRHYTASKESLLVHLRSVASYQQVIAENKLVVIFFSAATCGLCDVIAPKVEEFAGKYPDAAFFKVYFISWIGQLNTATNGKLF